MLDERQGTAAAKLFAEKGYDNVFLLNGGIEQFHFEFPDWIEGKDIPVPKNPKEKSKTLGAT